MHRHQHSARESSRLSARAAALEILCHWHREKKPVAGLLSRYSEALSAPDRQLTNKLLNGVFRELQYLDLVLSRFSKHPLRKMKPRSLMALRIGVYQLLFLDRVPESAAVNETIKAFKRKKQPQWLINFINGVLRQIARQFKNDPQSIEKIKDDVTNHPDWLVQRWQQRFGAEKLAHIIAINNQNPPLCLRANTHLISRDELLHLLRDKGVTARTGQYAPESIFIESFSGPIPGLPGYEQGLFQVQGEAAQLVTPLLAPFTAAKRYLDCCAGLGGKTSHLAQLLPAGAEAAGVEPDQRRFNLLGENLERLRLQERMQLFHKDIDGFAALNQEKFHAVLIDAPCSGTGVIRRHPEIRWNRREKDLQGYQKQQKELLARAASLLTRTGVIVYATCSIEPEENEEVVASFLRDHPNFSPADCRQYLPAQASGLVNEQGFFQVTPQQDLDGFFAARLARF